MTEAVARAIAFDLFHTLVDPEEFRPEGFHRAPAIAQLLGLPLEEFVARWEADVRERQVSVTPTVLERVQAMCREYEVSPRPEIWPQVTDILGRYTDLAILNPHRTVVRTLQRLRHLAWTLGLVSNCDEREKRSWNGSELSTLFDAAVFSCEVGCAKPAVDVYRALIPRWGGIPLEEAIFVGDGANDELVGARRAGFSRVVFQSQFVSVNRLRSAAENERLRAQADTSVGDLSELVGLLPRHPQGE